MMRGQGETLDITLRSTTLTLYAALLRSTLGVCRYDKLQCKENLYVFYACSLCVHNGSN